MPSLNEIFREFFDLNSSFSRSVSQQQTAPTPHVFEATQTTTAAVRRGDTAMQRQTIKTFRTYNNIEAFVSQRPHQEKMVTYNPHLSRPAITTTTASAGKPKTAEPTPPAGNGGMVRATSMRRRRSLASVYENSWRRSLRQSDQETQEHKQQQQQQQQERLLPAITNPNASRAYKNRTRSLERPSRRRERRLSSSQEEPGSGSGGSGADSLEDSSSSVNTYNLTHPRYMNHTQATYSVLTPSPRPPDEAIGVEGKGASNQQREADNSWQQSLRQSDQDTQEHKADKSKRNRGQRKEDDFQAFVRRNKLDTSLAEDITGEIISHNPGVGWKDIAGLEAAKSLLQEAVVLPLIMPDFFRGIRRPWKGILMTGPPGTGKTMLAKAVASECKTTFFNVSSSTLTSKYRGESEKMVKTLFEIARYFSPSIIFIDEVDALCSQRGSDSEHEASKRFKSELLMQMDGLTSTIDGSGVEEGGNVVMVLAATNYPWLIDNAFRRRFEKRIYIPLPNLEDRRALINLSLGQMDITGDVDYDDLAVQLDSYSGADITNLCRDAAMMSMRRAIKDKPIEEMMRLKKEDIDKPISQADLDAALERCKKTSDDVEVQRYAKWMDKHGSY